MAYSLLCANVFAYILFVSFSMRPNIFLGTCEGSTQYKKWYFEVMVDHIEPFLTAQPYHLRVGWALTEGYSPYPGGGEGWGGNGVGDDLYSYSFDGLHLWSGKWSLTTVLHISFLLLHICGLWIRGCRACSPSGCFSQSAHSFGGRRRQLLFGFERSQYLLPD